MVKQLKQVAYVLVVVLVVYVAFNVIGVGCPIKFLTGISCAGCGMTRAYISMLKGNLKTAFYFHPLFPVPMLYLVYYIGVKDKVSHHLDKTLMCFVIFLFVAVYLYRLFFSDNTVVIFDPKSGLLYKVLDYII